MKSSPCALSRPSSPSDDSSRVRPSSNESSPKSSKPLCSAAAILISSIAAMDLVHPLAAGDVDGLPAQVVGGFRGQKRHHVGRLFGQRCSTKLDLCGNRFQDCAAPGTVLVVLRIQQVI